MRPILLALAVAVLAACGGDPAPLFTITKSGVECPGAEQWTPPLGSEAVRICDWPCSSLDGALRLVFVRYAGGDWTLASAYHLACPVPKTRP